MVNRCIAGAEVEPGIAVCSFTKRKQPKPQIRMVAGCVEVAEREDFLVAGWIEEGFWVLSRRVERGWGVTTIPPLRSRKGAGCFGPFEAQGKRDDRFLGQCGLGGKTQW